MQRRRHFACAIAREDHVDRLEPCASSAGVLVEAKDGGRQLFESHDVVVTIRVADAARGTRRKRKPVAHPFARPLAQDLALPLDRHFHALLEQLVEHPRRVVHVHEHVGRLVEQLFQLASGLRSPSSSGARGGRGVGMRARRVSKCGSRRERRVEGTPSPLRPFLQWDIHRSSSEVGSCTCCSCPRAAASHSSCAQPGDGRT